MEDYTGEAWLLQHYRNDGTIDARLFCNNTKGLNVSLVFNLFFFSLHHLYFCYS